MTNKPFETESINIYLSFSTWSILPRMTDSARWVGLPIGLSSTSPINPRMIIRTFLNVNFGTSKIIFFEDYFNRIWNESLLKFPISHFTRKFKKYMIKAHYMIKDPYWKKLKMLSLLIFWWIFGVSILNQLFDNNSASKNRLIHKLSNQYGWSVFKISIEFIWCQNKSVQSVLLSPSSNHTFETRLQKLVSFSYRRPVEYICLNWQNAIYYLLRKAMTFNSARRFLTISGAYSYTHPFSKTTTNFTYFKWSELCLFLHREVLCIFKILHI